MNITPHTAQRNTGSAGSIRRRFRPTVYIVAWEHAEVVKVGYTTSPRRWRAFEARGARVLGIEEHESGLDALGRERALQADLASFCEPAFSSRVEADPYLGGQGAGWTECYRVAAFPVEMMLKYAPSPYRLVS